MPDAVGGASPERLAHVVVRTSGAVLALLAVSVLAGWAAQSRLVVAWGSHLTPMRPQTACAFLVLAFGLTAATTRLARRSVDAAGVLLVLLGAGVLAEFARSAATRADLLLFDETVRAFTPTPETAGRMSPGTAVAFVLLGVALVLRRRVHVVSAVGLFLLAASAAALLGYEYGASRLFNVTEITAVAVDTSTGLAVASVGLLALAPRTGLARLLTDPGGAGILARRLLPTAVVVPPLVGVLLEVGRRHEQWDFAFSASILTVLTTVAVVAATARAASLVGRLHDAQAAARAEAEDAAQRLAERTAELQAVLDVAPVGIVRTDADGRCVWVNDAWLALTQSSRVAAMGEGWRSAVHPDDRDRLAAGDGADEREQELSGPFRLQRPDGQTLLVSAAARAVREGGEPSGMLWTVLDTTRESRAAERFRAAFEEAPVGMGLLSADHVFTQANGALARLVGLAPGELPGRHVAELTHPEDVPVLARALGDAAGDAPFVQADLRWVDDTSADPVWVSVHAVQLAESGGMPARFLLHVLDLTERRTHERELEHLADHDALTGLLNRRGLHRRLEEHLGLAKRYGGGGALLLFDLDDFKLVNDTLGHQAGDRAIERAGRAVRNRLRATDVVGRLGGDEFAVFLPHAGRVEAVRVADDLLTEIRTHVRPTDEAESPYPVTASMGVALVGDAAAPTALDSLFSEADLAMYDAKDAGGNRYALGGPDETGASRARTRQRWAGRMRTALSEDRFVLHAQPVVDLRSGAWSHHELLLRLVEEDGSLVLPSEFVGLAEETGSIQAVDRWVVEHAIDLAAGLPEAHVFEVNLSGRSLDDPELVQAIRDRVRAGRVDPQRLVFEVTETDAAADLPCARAFAEAVRSLGCRFALDDFGAGFGAFASLRHLPVDFVKIDGGFVRHCATDPNDRLLVKAVVSVAHGMHSKTIAEHVSDPVILETVRSLGVDYAQGFEIGRPVPAAEALPRAADRPGPVEV